MRKISVFMVVGVLAIAACSPAAVTVADKPAGPVVLPVFSYNFGSSPDFENNDLTKYMEKNYNVDFQWSLVSPEDVVEKQNLLLASGNYPPVMFGKFSQNDQIKYGAAKSFIPLNDLIEKYGENIKKAFETSPYLKQGVVSPDGNIYALPGLEECYHCDYAQKLYINVDWLKKLNLKMPTSTDELENVLLAFKEKDPNGNGKADEIPLTGANAWWHSEPHGFIMNAFIYDDEERFLNLTNGVVSTPANTPEWKEGLAFVRKLYSQGLIDPAGYTQNYDQLLVLSEAQGGVVTMGAFTGGCCVPTHAVANAVWTQYEVVPPIKGPHGVQNVGFFGEGVENGIFVITDKASEEQKIAAIKVVDYFFSEHGAISHMYGPEGIGWTKANPGDMGIDGKPAIYNSEEPSSRVDKKQNVTWGIDLKYTPKRVFDGRAQSQDTKAPDGYERYLAVETDKLVGFKPKEVYPRVIWFDPKDAQTIAQMQTDITAYIKTSALQFITGQKDLNTDWESYVEGFKGLQLDEYLKYNQAAYDKQYKK
ncbi:MAG: extracellular solute-binding protein [Pseudohongiellaceae bacterium]